MHTEDSSESSGFSTAVTCLLIGVGIGAVTALLLAPKSGKQLRKDMRRTYEDARETVDDWRREAREVAEEAIERGSKIAGQVREKIAPLTRAVGRE